MRWHRVYWQRSQCLWPSKETSVQIPVPFHAQFSNFCSRVSTRVTVLQPLTMPGVNWVRGNPWYFKSITYLSCPWAVSSVCRSRWKCSFAQWKTQWFFSRWWPKQSNKSNYPPQGMCTSRYFLMPWAPEECLFTVGNTPIPSAWCASTFWKFLTSFLPREFSESVGKKTTKKPQPHEENWGAPRNRELSVKAHLLSVHLVSFLCRLSICRLRHPCWYHWNGKSVINWFYVRKISVPHHSKSFIMLMMTMKNSQCNSKQNDHLASKKHILSRLLLCSMWSVCSFSRFAEEGKSLHVSIPDSLEADLFSSFPTICHFIGEWILIWNSWALAHCRVIDGSDRKPRQEGKPAHTLMDTRAASLTSVLDREEILQGIWLWCPCSL